MTTSPSPSGLGFNRRYFRNPSRSKYSITSLLAGLIRDLPKGGRVLELGCGDLQVLKSIQGIRPDLELAGVDCGEIGAEDQFAGIRFTRARIEEFRSDLHYDLVLGIDVLEHLARPDELVRAASSALRRGGSLYVSAPHVTKILLLGDANFYADYSHVRPFSEKSIRRLLEDGGFEVRAAQVHGSSPRARWRLLYYAARGLLTADTNYLNAAILCVGGHAVEAAAIATS